MTTTTIDAHELEHLTAEMQGLRRSLPHLVETWGLTFLLIARIGNVWAMLKLIEREVMETPDDEPIDPEDQLDRDFLGLAQSLSGLVRFLDQLGFRNLRTRLIRRLLVRLHDRIERLRTWIREHDADCEQVLYGPYESAEELIAALDAKDD